MKRRRKNSPAPSIAPSNGWKAIRPKTSQKTIQKEFADTDPAIIETSIERYKKQKSFSADPVLQKDEWEQLQSIMDEAGELPKHIPYSKLVNTKIAKKVTSEQ